MIWDRKAFWIWVAGVFCLAAVFTYRVFGVSYTQALMAAAGVSAMYAVGRVVWRELGLYRVLEWISLHSPLRKLPKTMAIIIIAFSLMIFLYAAALIIIRHMSQPPDAPKLTYTKFVAKAEKHEIGEFVVLKYEAKLFQPTVIVFFTDLADGKNKWAYFPNAPAYIPQVTPEEWLRLLEYDVDPKYPFSMPFLLFQTLQGFTMSIPFFFFLWFIGGGGLRSIGEDFAAFRSSKRMVGKRITFDNVAGMKEEKEMFQEYIDFLRDPRPYEGIGGRMQKGILFHGLPGVGKTHFARACAGEANVPVFMVSGSDFHFMFVGVGPNKAERLFEQAKRAAPSMLIIDELDSAAPARAGGNWEGGSHRESVSLVNKLLSLMDEIDKEEIPVIVVAITNRIDALDSAILREGRFDTHVYVPPPDLEGRIGILEVHTSLPKPTPLAQDVNFKEVAQLVPGWAGSKLAAMANKAKLRAVKRKAKEVSQEDFIAVIDLVQLGPLTHHELTEEEKRCVAYHETGHGLASFVLPGCNPLRRLTLEMHGHTLGHASTPPERDFALTPESRVLSEAKVALAGDAAEHVINREGSTGSRHDKEAATQAIQDFVFSGMDEEFGPVSLYALQKDGKGSSRFGSATSLQGEGEERVRTILATGRKEMVELFSQPLWKETLKNVAEKLLEKTTLTGEQVRDLIPDELLRGTRYEKVEN